MNDLIYIDYIFVKDRQVKLYRNTENKIEGYYTMRGELNRIITPHEDEKEACDYIRESFKRKRAKKMKLPVIPLDFNEDTARHHTGE